jgi:hypothetical protein
VGMDGICWDVNGLCDFYTQYIPKYKSEKIFWIRQNLAGYLRKFFPEISLNMNGMLLSYLSNT